MRQRRLAMSIAVTRKNLLSSGLKLLPLLLFPLACCVISTEQVDAQKTVDPAPSVTNGSAEKQEPEPQGGEQEKPVNQESIKSLAEWLQGRVVDVFVRQSTDVEDLFKCQGYIELPAKFKDLEKIELLPSAPLRAEAPLVPAPKVDVRLQSSADQNPQLQITLVFETHHQNVNGNYTIEMHFPEYDAQPLKATLNCRVPGIKFEPVGTAVVEQRTFFGRLNEEWQWFLGPTWKHPELQFDGGHEAVPIRFKYSQPMIGESQVHGEFKPVLMPDANRKPTLFTTLQAGETRPVRPEISSKFELGRSSSTLAVTSPYGEITVPVIVKAHEVWIMIPIWIGLGIGVSYVLKKLIPALKTKIDLNEAIARLRNDLTKAEKNRADLAPMIAELRSKLTELDITGVTDVQATGYDAKRIFLISELRDSLDQQIAAFENERQTVGQTLVNLRSSLSALRPWSEQYGFEEELRKRLHEFGADDGDYPPIESGEIANAKRRLAHIQQEFTGTVADSFDKRRNSVETYILKRELPALSPPAPSDVRSRWSQGIDNIQGAWAHTPADQTTDLDGWESVLSASSNFLGAALHTLARDVNERLEATASAIRDVCNNRPELQDEIAALENARRKVDAVSFRKAAALPNIDDTFAKSHFWTPLRKSIEAAWELLNSAKEFAQFDQAEKAEYEALRNSGDLSSALSKIRTKLQIVALATSGHELALSPDDTPTSRFAARPPEPLPSLVPIGYFPSARATPVAWQFRQQWDHGRSVFTEQRISLERLEAMLLIGFSLGVGTLLFWSSFVGDVTQITTLFVWGLGVDLGFSSLLTQLKSVPAKG